MPKIKIKGTIIPNDYKWLYDLFEIEATCPGDVSGIIDKANGEALDVEINSGGGDVWSGSEIYTALKSYAGNVVVNIMGFAGSAASVIAMGGKTVRISPTAQIMIHNVSNSASGDYRDMQHMAGVLENYNKSIANAYILKTGMVEADLLALMNKETWLNAQQSKEMGFVDEILFDTENKLVAAGAGVMIFPPGVVNKLRNLIKVPQISNTDQSLQQARLNFLKLKGEQINE